MADMFKTPLCAWHESHGAKMAPFAGWYMPIQYEGILTEHKHTRSMASIFDICHMGEFFVSGAGAKEALMKAMSHSLETLKEGRCRYGFILNEKGGVLDDCIIYNMGDTFFIVVNAACIDRDFKTIAERLPSGVTIVNKSDEIAKIDLQGPLSVDILEKLLGQNLRDLGYFAFRETEWNGKKLLVSRTGYTGELGYELYIDAKYTIDLWEALLGDPRVKPAGLGARDTLRMEAGLPLYGDKLTLTNGTEVGRVTSGTFAPSLGKAIAFAWVQADKANENDFLIQTGRASLKAHRTEIPFYKDGTARRKLQ